MKIGFGQENINPSFPTTLAGAAFRRVATSIHDDLFAKAMVLDDGHTIVAMVGCDLVALSRQTVAKAREIIENKCGIDRNNILIAATHVHTGPYSCGIIGRSPDKIYMEMLPYKIASAVCSAYYNLTEADIGIGTGEAPDGTFLRRFIMADGKSEAAPPQGSDEIIKPEGTKDPQVGVIYAEKQRVPLGVLVNYSSHCTSVGWIKGVDWVISADYPAYIAQILRKTKGEKFISVFLNGACGNLNPNNYQEKDPPKSHKLAERTGTLVGNEALKIIEKVKLSSKLSVGAISKIVSIPTRKIPEERLEEARKLTKDVTEDIYEGEFPGITMRNRFDNIRGKRIWAKAFLQLEEERRRNPYVNFEVQVIKIGNGAIVGFPVELFTEFGLEIKKKSPFPYTFIAELANECEGYIPTREAFSREGKYSYETLTCKFIPEAGDILVKTAVELLEKLAR